MIDDRRIHVDFSQSVSKFMPKMKNKNEKKKLNGESRQKMKELVTKVKDGRTFFGQTQYEFVNK